MRLIPPSIAETTQSGGERAVFDALAATSARAAASAGGAAAGPSSSSAPDTTGWTVLHSFDIADHRRQLAGEIDFLCIVPGKGVRLRRDLGGVGLLAGDRSARRGMRTAAGSEG